MESYLNNETFTLKDNTRFRRRGEVPLQAYRWAERLQTHLVGLRLVNGTVFGFSKTPLRTGNFLSQKLLMVVALSPPTVPLT